MQNLPAVNPFNEVTLQIVLDRIEVLANAILSNKPILSLEEASAFTGLATSYLYKLTSTQEIPHYKPRGKMLYFDRGELEAWLKQNRVNSNADIERKAAAHVAGVSI